MDLVGKAYGELFSHLSQQGIIPIGLYRGIIPHINKGVRQNRLSYVYTNPEESSEIFPCDRVFVLSTKPLFNTQRNVTVSNVQTCS